MKLIILAGMPATGKSTVARRLQEAFGYPILEKDAIKKRCLTPWALPAMMKNAGWTSRPTPFC
ncbi:MAG: dephospho-CoA kinase [Clostridia bacterium]|nr:dephospho-CoA kinase [Clostridia bacterium]